MQTTYWYKSCTEGWLSINRTSYERMKEWGGDAGLMVGPPCPQQKRGGEGNDCAAMERHHKKKRKAKAA